MRIAILFLLLLGPLQAQFWSEVANPKVEVRLAHPPEAGLRLRKVAFAPTPYPASRELADLLAGEVLRDRRLEVVDAGRLDPRDEPVGSVAQATVDVHRCRPVFSTSSKESKDAKGGITVTRTATTTLEFSATVVLTEPGSGRLLATRKFEEAPSDSRSSSLDAPAAPGDGELRRAAQRKVVDWLFQALLPWDEVLRVTYFDDDAYQMDRAAARFKAGDARGGHDLAQRGEAEAQADRGGKAKYRERAIYNLGVARMVLGDFEGALPKLQAARDLNRDASIFRDTLQACQRALDLKAAMEAYGRTAPGPSAPAAGPARKDPEQRLLELERLLKKGLISDQDYQRRKDEILREI